LSPGTQLGRVVSSLKESGLIQIGGVLTTTAISSQQWDAPNAWPPLQLLLIEGLIATGLNDARLTAETLEKDWLATNYKAYNSSGYMYEKYNAFEFGVGGGGGEYKPQQGFGWSNGVALVMLNRSGGPTGVFC